MRLVVKQGERLVNEFHFTKGPISLGRHADSQVFLPDRVVSRHHAVIFNTQDGKWMLEDLDSANKTYLNGKEIHKSEINSGDVIRVTDFTIEVDLKESEQKETGINMEDTLSSSTASPSDTLRTVLEPQIITRNINAEHAPEIRLPAKRARDFLNATEKICKTNNLEEVKNILLNIASKQFIAYHTWCGLSNQPNGPMECQTGKRRDGSIVMLNEIKLKDRIDEAAQKKQFLLLPRIPAKIGKEEKEKINSAMIAPIMGLTGCFGVLYLDNDMSHEHYTISDLDYLMLLTIHTGVILENF